MLPSVLEMLTTTFLVLRSRRGINVRVTSAGPPMLVSTVRMRSAMSMVLGKSSLGAYIKHTRCVSAVYYSGLT